jgi:hypothetical protein
MMEEEDEEEVDEVTMARTAVLLGNHIIMISSCNNNILVIGRCLRCSQTAGVVTAISSCIYWVGTLGPYCKRSGGW